MSVQFIFSRLEAAARSVLGLPPKEVYELPGFGSARILGVQPVRAWTTAGATIKFYS